MRTTFQSIKKLAVPFTYPAGSGTATATIQATNFEGWPALVANLLACIDVQALTTTQLPNAATLTFSILMSNSYNLAAPISTTQIGVVTGANSTGAAAQTFAGRIPTTGGQFIGLQIVASSGAAASALTGTFYLSTSE